MTEQEQLNEQLIEIGKQLYKKQYDLLYLKVKYPAAVKLAKEFGLSEPTLLSFEEWDAENKAYVDPEEGGDFCCPDCLNRYEFHFDGNGWVFQLVQKA